VAHFRRPRSNIVWLLALAMVGCSTGSSASPGGIASGSASASIGAAPNPPATPLASPALARWVVTDLPFPKGATPCAPEDGGVQNLRVVSFGAGLLAFGSCAHTASQSLVWVSADGHSYEGVAPAALATADVYDLIVADGLLVAVGRTSRDGFSWTRSVGDLGCAVISTVTRFGSGFVAFGNRSPNDTPAIGGQPQGACEWVSSDGLSWKPVDLPKAVFPDTAGVASVSAGPGGLIAVGSAAGPERSVAALWHSSDGRTWTRLAGPGATDWLSLDMALPAGPGLVVLGTEGHGNAWLATSADAITWAAAAAPGEGTLSGGPSLASGSAGFIFGGFPMNASPSSAIAWLSVDGVSWQPAPTLPSGLDYRSVAADAGGFVLAASTSVGGAAVITLEP